MSRVAPPKRWLAGSITLLLLVMVVIFARTGAAVEADETAPNNPTPDTKVVPEPGWPMFGGSNGPRNHVNHSLQYPPTHWSIEWRDFQGRLRAKDENIKWKVKLGSRTYGGPVIAGGKIFIGTNNQNPRNPAIKGDKGILMCFRESDGQFLWQAVHDKLPSGQVNDWPQEGIASHPVVEGNRIYYVSNRGELVCADVNGLADGNDGAQDEKYRSLQDADFIWRLDMIKELGVFPHNLSACSPLLAGDLLFVVTGNGVDEGHVNTPNPQAPSFLAVHKHTGKVLWQTNAPSARTPRPLKLERPDTLQNDKTLNQLRLQGGVIMHGQWSNPAFAEIRGRPQVIFPGGDGWLRAYEPSTGKLIWQFDANPKDSVYELGGTGKRSDFIATPVVAGERLYIGTGQDPEHYEGVGHLWCIDLAQATLKGGDVSPELVTDAKAEPVKTRPNPSSAVVWHYGGPTTKKDQDRLQRDYYFGRTMSNMTVQGGLVYAAELAGYLHCLDADTGKPYWVYDLKAAVWGAPSWIGGYVYLGTEDGDVWIFRHGAICDLRGRIDMRQPVRTTSPIAHQGVLYVTTESYLYAIR